MSRQIKVIWDFKGQDAEETAKHHVIHLKEFNQRENINALNFGEEQINAMHFIAYITVTEENVYTVRDALKPHRAEIV